MICGWQIFMRLKTQPVLAPSRGGVKPPVQLVVLIVFVTYRVTLHAVGGQDLTGDFEVFILGMNVDIFHGCEVFLTAHRL